MVKNIKTAMMRGLKSIPVRVESDVSNGLPMFELVGYVSSEVKEAKERVRSALMSFDFSLPVKRITVNLSPATEKKSGTTFDLSIALSILLSAGDIKEPSYDFFVLGELSLDGRILPLKGVLPMIECGKKEGIRHFIIPKENEEEALFAIEDGIMIYPVKTLGEAVEALEGNYLSQSIAFGKKNEGNDEGIGSGSGIDFSDIRGQKLLKRACEVAVSGMHNFLMVGSPGAGKTLTARAIPSILPPLSREEELSIASIYSICGKFQELSVSGGRRPFRAPHHSISARLLSGGGNVPYPGELTLSHKGVLFLDELTEFNDRTLEVLRQPLEDGIIKVYHDKGEEEYPADFMLVCAMNPCRCGYYPDRKRCRCTLSEIRQYMQRISRPLLDRIDISVEVKPLSFLEAAEDIKEESSDVIRKRVMKVHEIEEERFKNESFSFNSKIPHTLLSKYCPLSSGDKSYMEETFEKLSLSARAYHRILRVARTIADMDGASQIKREHLYEAICYRTIDKRFWEGGV